ncbi:MAG: hypothetical protein Ct9H300mP14_05840 [Gammaproteobacteria bacterium]|nr:MAG: hypothetical protein Ct9H300mP14_05840 [Gammaproteobacteria bacterium]
MLSGYLLTNRRSGNFSYVIGAGNQSVLGVEDYLEALLTRSEVTAFGIYLESLRDIPQFAKAALNALDRNIPLVVLKVGRSDLAARTTLTHTGSLAGSDTLYQALFDRLGVVRVPTPSLMLETLNLLTIAGAQLVSDWPLLPAPAVTLPCWLTGERSAESTSKPLHLQPVTSSRAYCRPLQPYPIPWITPLRCGATRKSSSRSSAHWSRMITMRRCWSRIIPRRILRRPPPVPGRRTRIYAGHT